MNLHFSDVILSMKEIQLFPDHKHHHSLFPSQDSNLTEADKHAEKT